MALAIGALIGALAIIAFIVTSAPRADDALPTRSPAPASTSSDAFRAGFAPLLARAVANAADLVTIGDAKERNLLRIHAAQQAMSAALADADAWLATHTPPAADEPAVAAYQRGAVAIRRAIDEAQAGFLRFDFARVARATETMRQGAADLRDALALLNVPAEPSATPAGTPARLRVTKVL